MGSEFAERGMELGLRLAEKRMEMEERLGRDWDRRWDQDWDQDRRRDHYQGNNRGNYDRRDRWYWESLQRELPIQTVYFFKGGKTGVSSPAYQTDLLHSCTNSSYELNITRC